MQKRIFSAVAGVLCTCMCVAALPQGVRAEESSGETAQYKRIQCHNGSYYMAVSESDPDKPYATASSDYGLDSTVWIEEEVEAAGQAEQDQTDSGEGSRVVRLKNYATGTYLGVEGGDLIMMEDTDSDNVKWEVEIKWDDSTDYWTGAADFAWNRYKSLSESASGQYPCTEGLSGDGELILSGEAKTELNDNWWSNQWKYIDVDESELITKPGDIATDEQKAALSSAIDAAKAKLADGNSYRRGGIFALEDVVEMAEKIYTASNVSGNTIEAQTEAVNSAAAALETVKDGTLYAPGEMAIEGAETIGDSGEYYLDLSEEFDGDALNSDVWLDEYFPHWTSDESKAQARYEMKDGKLTLKVSTKDGPWSENDGDVIVSGISTYNQNYLHDFTGSNTLYEHPDSTKTDNNYFNGYTTQYGYIEMRAKLWYDGGGGHQALWMVGTQDDNTESSYSTKTAEIDMLETGFFNSYDTWRQCATAWHDAQYSAGLGMNTDYSGGWITRNHKLPALSETGEMGDPSQEFHTFGMEWTPDKLYFYYDGELCCVAEGAPQYEMGLVLSIYAQAGWSTNEANGTGKPRVEGDKQMEVDYIRVYKPVGGYDNGYIDTAAAETLLTESIAEAAKTDRYTADALEKLNAVIREAQAVIGADNVTKQDVLDQVAALRSALNTLKSEGEIQTENPNEKPADDPDKESADNQDQDLTGSAGNDGGKSAAQKTSVHADAPTENTKAAETGDAAKMFPIVAILALSAAAALSAGILRRKQR